MSFDTETRNRLSRFVTRCRSLLCGDYSKPGGEMTNQLAHFGIQPNGESLDLDALDHLSEPEFELAGTLRDILAHKNTNTPASKVWKKFDPAVYDLVQEQGFTVLNRLCALRMAEERGIIVSAGLQSDGFQLFEMHSDKSIASIDVGQRYQHFLFALFDELSLSLGSLFDRANPQGLLFPAPAALAELLEEINHSDLKDLWAEDETIGWIYQYWNSKEERKAMRDASAAPRNSRELAVRNQFFTPRYVVEFLTDNTLGRIWYEMTKGDTRLAEQCRYLVRRPTEIFLGDGEAQPEPCDLNPETLSQEELLRQPVHIPHRPVKDPREIRLLDPACGSMHFGLYAFDLFEAIYEEAWDEGLCPSLQEAYPEKADYLRDVPKLIIEHNIHGVDIDPRAVQIAGLSLWLRAQKTWKDTPAAERPRVRRSNIVCAEPMPGSDAMLEDFVQTLDPPLLGELVKTVFDKMQLAGEAGTLLKIEEEIRTAIDDAKAKWEKLGAAERDLFSAEELNQTLRPGTQKELSGVEKALTTDHRPLTTDFFDTAEERIYAALRDYAESAEAGDYQRRLFAEDATHGFAFIDLCRKRYDTVVMNPPFGSPSSETIQYLNEKIPEWSDNILCAFISRSINLLVECGRSGAIFDRSVSIRNSYEDFRREIILPHLDGLADTGWHVLDADVETTLQIYRKPRTNTMCAFVDTLSEEPETKASTIELKFKQVAKGILEPNTYAAHPKKLAHLPNAVIGYYFQDFLVSSFDSWPSLAASKLQAREGHTFSSEEHLRLFWEIPPNITPKPHGDFCSVYNGSGYTLFFTPIKYVGRYGNDAALIKHHKSVALRNKSYQFKSGVGYGKRGDIFDAHILPMETSFTSEGQAITGIDQADAITCIGFLNSSFSQFALNSFCGQHKRSGYVNKLPFPSSLSTESINDNTLEIVRLKRSWCQLDQTSREFIGWSFPGTSKIPQSLTAAQEALNYKFDSEQNELLDRICSNDDFFLNAAKPTGEERKRVSDFAVARPYDVVWPDFEGVDESGLNIRHFFEDWLSIILGYALGRWDIRYATGERQPPELPDPFDPLPVCPPGMLQNADGLPAAPADVPDDYPLPITWPGILVSDPGHPEDIVARVRDALAVIWGDRSAAIEQEACEILGIKSGTLRDYFAEKKSGGKFFKDHLKRYSKSRRQAPIYWPLSTESGTYTLWIYYHRLSPDTLYRCVNSFIEPKQEEVQKTLNTLRKAGDGITPDEEKELAAAELLVGELAIFREDLERLAKVWKPNLNDGVQITAAPLWKHFRHKPWQKKLKETYTKMEQGEYDWAHLSHTLWPQRVIPKCATDRSLAIAHNYESDLWEEVENAKGKPTWQPKENAEEIVKNLISKL